MKKETPAARKAMEQALKDGDFIAISSFDTRKAGIVVKVVIPKADTDLIEKRTAKRMKSFLSAVAWMIHKCQANKVPASAVVALAAASMPPLAMSCVPMSATDLTPVIVVGRRKKEETK